MAQISLRAARLTAGISREEAAKKLGVAESTIARWEQGNSRIDAKAFLTLCELYHFDASDIFLP